MIVQARALLAEVARELLGAAGQLERQPQRVDDVLRHMSAAEGAKITGAVPCHLADHLQNRVFLLQIDAQIGIALVVLQKDVVLRHVPLDQ